jgi:hypothetical protein
MVTIKDEILDPYFIQLDEYQYILKVIKKKNKDHHFSKEGKKNTYEIKLGYYADLKAALKAAARRKITDSKSTVSIKEYITQYENIIKSLNSIFDV